MKTTEEMIEIMQAYERGGQIQYYSSIIHQWVDTMKPVWNWADFDYCIKHKKKFVPFESVEEFLAAQKNMDVKLFIFQVKVSLEHSFL